MIVCNSSNSDDDENEEEDDSGIEAGIHETEPESEPKPEVISGIKSTEKMCEDEGIDFDKIFQAQRASASLQVNAQQIKFPDDQDDDIACGGVEVNSHQLGLSEGEEGNQGLMTFNWSTLENDDDDDAGKAASTANADPPAAPAVISIAHLVRVVQGWCTALKATGLLSCL